MTRTGRATALVVVINLFLAHGVSVTKAQDVTLTTRGAEVWSQTQRVSGTVTGTRAGRGVLYVNGVGEGFDIERSRFTVPVWLTEPESVVIARVEHRGRRLESAPVTLTLGFTPRPEVHVYATVAGRTVTLRRTVLANPLADRLTFRWTQDPDNPLRLRLRRGRFTLPTDAPLGEYSFTLHVRSTKGLWRVRTLVTVTGTEVTAFDVERDHAAWIDRAVIYGVTPYAFVPGGGFADVTAKIPELAKLGVTALWLQPIFETFDGGQGYDVTDYFGIRPDYGTAAELRTLVRTAHAHGLRVLLDFVPNHTSLEHPYAQDAVRYGRRSHYHNFYQHERDNARYAVHYNTRREGELDFVYYFWPDFPNLDYDNPEVQRWMIEAGRYWIERFDIDGYRVDAVWGVNARHPAFMQRWRRALKRLKPDFLLLGEDKAGLAATFDRHFDAAYDWTDSENWVSQWSWQTDYTPDYSQNPMIFNHPDETARAELLAQALADDGRTHGLTLRFLENNDTPRFLPTHEPNGFERTKMAAALMFSLPGIPLVYNGQEVGYPVHPYETPSIFSANRTIRSQDKYGLFPYYRKLIALRKRLPALTGPNFELLPTVSRGGVLAFHRWHGGQHLVGVVNLAGTRDTAKVGLDLEVAKVRIDEGVVTDLFSGEAVKVELRGQELRVEMEAYSAYLFSVRAAP